MFPIINIIITEYVYTSRSRTLFYFIGSLSNEVGIFLVFTNIFVGSCSFLAT